MQAIKKTNLPDAISQRLLEMIRSGELSAGDRLPSEPQLSKSLGVSRASLREGIKALAVLNLLNILA